jgi:hypothetical protein
MPGRPQWPLARAVTRPQPLMRVEAQRQSSRARWPLARVVTRPQSATQLRAGLLKPRLSLGFDFISGRRGRGEFPDDLKSPVVTDLNAVVDRRCDALVDHCLGVFGPVGYGLRNGILGAPARATQAAAPLLFGVLIDYMGIGVLAISAGLSLSALFALLFLKARPAAAPVPA